MRYMNRLGAVLVSLSQWRYVIFTQVLNALAFGTLMSLDGRFKAIAGYPVFDTQNTLTAEQLRIQRGAYVGDALTAYHAFAAFDFVFPLIAAFGLVVTCATLLKASRHPIANKLVATGVPFVFMVPTLFDWMENISILRLLSNGTGNYEGDIASVLAFKAAKLGSLMVSGVLIGLALLWMCVSLVRLRVLRDRN